MVSRLTTRLWSGVYLLSLWVGYLGAGWLLAAWGASSWVWWGTLGITLHLAKVGMDGLVLANTWVVGLMFLAAVLKTWFKGTVLWNVPNTNAPLWASVLLLIWGGAIALILGLAAAQKPLLNLGCPPRLIFYSLGLGIWGALILGGWIYNQFIVFFNPPV